MNTNPLDDPPQTTLADGARDTVRKTGEAAQEAYRKTAEAAQQTLRKTGEVAQATYESARHNCEDTLDRTRTYVRENPVPAVVGAFVLGAVLSFALAGMRRHEPTLRERLLDDPLESIRDTIFAALTPVGKRLHSQYDSARETAGEALERAHDSASRHAGSWSKQLRRASHNLKFW